MKKILFIAISFLVVTIGFSQIEDSIMIKKISDDILINGKAYENLRHLTKKIGGRLAGSPQMTIAEQWGEQVMRSSGADRVIMQECKVPHWVRGGEDKAEVTGGKKLDVVALGNSMGSGKKGVKAEVLLVNSYDDLEKKRDEV
ncbi:MAG TPA: peptidase M28 family protein, partial [Chitinophagaceae bacterium]